MSFLLSNWRLVGAFALVVLVSLGAYMHGVDTTTTKYELQEVERALADAKVVIENKRVIDALKGEKDDAQKRVDALAADNKRLRVLFPGCRRNVPVPVTDNSASRSSQPIAGGEPLPEPAEGPQVALDAFMGEGDADAYAADSLVNECRMVYKWAKDLGR